MLICSVTNFVIQYNVGFVTWKANCNPHGFLASVVAFHNAETTPLPIHGNLEDHRLLKKQNNNKNKWSNFKLYQVLYYIFCNRKLSLSLFISAFLAYISIQLQWLYVERVVYIKYLHGFCLLEMIVCGDGPKANHLVGENRNWRWRRVYYVLLFIGLFGRLVRAIWSNEDHCLRKCREHLFS